MKVLFFHHGHARGGAALSLLYLVDELKKLGVECTLVDTLDFQEVVDLYERHVSKVLSSRIWYFPHNNLYWIKLNSIVGILRLLKWLLLFPLGCWRVYRLVSSSNCTIVHFNSATLIPYGWVARICGKSLVCHIREPFAAGHFGKRRRILRWLLRRSTHQCIAICEDNREDTILSEEQIRTIYNPIDFSKFDFESFDATQIRSDLGISHSAFVVLFAGGSNAKVKGVGDFLLSMLEVADEIKELICLMPSFDETNLCDSRLKNAYATLKLRIIESDFVYDIERWIAASDVVYALHQTPHFSRTVVEAGAIQRPVIATDIAGISEVVESGVNGLLCPVGDLPAIVDATLSLAQDEPLRKEMGRNGYSQASLLFRAESHARQVYRVYEGICADE
ncbi:MAG: glycosyltransferase family 4 protein [Paracoccaceae bacterium]